LQGVFRDVFDRPDMVLTPDLNASMVEGWDSFMQVTLIIATEEAFEVKFALSELERLRNVGEMVQLLDQKFGVR
jgi:acyl carrier protein